ncbi:hypothetical protein [Ferrimonas balearica]|uniref:hypothetical protein n=1 Tax=Ferrimonas balearica TaxID=44012 RepID=UPI001C993243|nr:hypothetical protein [Ferrimonas balearica]MBY5920666.1 hypothetical protein [Ferrimonas balearica]MBY5996649.1 hypothetical protein [Ferrimonas balearica]
MKISTPVLRRVISLALLMVLGLSQIFASCLTVAPEYSGDEHHLEAAAMACDSAVQTLTPGEVSEHDHTPHSHLPCHPPTDHNLHFEQPDSTLILSRAVYRPDRRAAPPIPPPNV